MTDHQIDLISRYAFYTCTVAAVLFPIIYSRLPWRTSAVGRGLMTLSFALGVIFAITSALFLGIIRRPPRLLYAVLYVWLAFALWRHLIVLIRIRLRARRLPLRRRATDEPLEVRADEIPSDEPASD